MERNIKIQYNPQKEFATESAAGHSVGLMTADELTTLLASVSKIYVDPVDGDDANDGESEAAAVLTMAEGIAKAVDGDFDAVVLMPGSHGYLASHNLFGKKLIAKAGARIIDLGTYGNTSFTTAFVFSGTQYFYDKLLPTLTSFEPGQPVWFTGRDDKGIAALKSNRQYQVCVHPGGEMRLISYKMWFDETTESKIAHTGLATEWSVADTLGEMETYFAAHGYASLGFPGSLFDCFNTTVYNRLATYTDGAGRVFVALTIRCDLTGGSSYRHITTIWHNGAIQYWYDNPVTTGYIDNGALNYGSAVDAMPMIRQGVLHYSDHTDITVRAVQPNKRYVDTGYEFSLTETWARDAVNNNRTMVSAVYFDGVPMFSTFLGDDKCCSAQQLSDALETAAGVPASLPSWADDFIRTEQRFLAKTLGYTFAGPYNILAGDNFTARTNPNCPYMTSQRMLSTDAAASDFDPVFFESAESLSDNVFCGGAVINVLHYAPQPPTKHFFTGSSYGIVAPTLPVCGLGVNSRLQNCEVYTCDIGRQVLAYEGDDLAIVDSTNWDRANRLYIEAWFTTTAVTTDLAGGVTHSDKCRTINFNRFSINRTAFDRRLKNSACVGMYLIAEHVQLWHISATVCVYATIDDTLMHGCCFSYFTGYYLTPDASPITATYCWIKEALASNLIPPDSDVTNSQSGDPLFRNTGSPYDLRLQALAKDDFFDSPAIAFTPEVSAFGGAREAGAYDEKATVTTTWSEFTIVFPWMMPTGIDRLRLENRRTDGKKTKLSVSTGTWNAALGWTYALSEADLRNIELMLAASSSLVRIFLNPISKPTKYLEGYLTHSVKNGGPFGLMPNLSDKVSLEFDAKMPADSIYEYL